LSYYIICDRHARIVGKKLFETNIFIVLDVIRR
jgi:hypothetical protein